MSFIRSISTEIRNQIIKFLFSFSFLGLMNDNVTFILKEPIKIKSLWFCLTYTF